ncbi:hypothetical protein [Bradyrhizobium sp. BR13661]|jgi:hypothetical protein|uniref:hypothetical protein n=1 Tax=Bradyrhizobium sp. BR13661 TaxID=2940622 RepID=UPI002474A075|nr:hypothetical protein [Bradyrhizobium sp. BR13661]MDH6258168.1 hypothetical protein [Bradyrhizobium sp. BR13661]
MMLRGAVGIVILLMSAYGARALTSGAADELDDDERASRSAAVSTIWDKPAPPIRVVVPQVTPAPPPERPLGANPLWALPLSALSATRDRPMFSPERRPPIAAVAPTPIAQPAAVQKPRDPERPQLSLIGTVVSSDERFGLFLDQMTQAALRLRMGESYRGWNLRLIQGREATLEKDQEAVILALPQRGAEQSAGEVRFPPANGNKLPLEKSSWPSPLSSK